MTLRSGGPRARRLTLRAWTLVWLVLVWVLLWGEFSWANLISGLAVALLVIVLLPLPPVPVEGRLHPISLIHLAAQVTWYLIQSSVQMAWLAIRPAPPPPAAVLRADLHIKSDLVLALAVNIINLIPGTIVLEIDQVRRLIYVHVIDVGSERAVRRFYQQIAKVDQLLVATFERDAEWRSAADSDGPSTGGSR